jgi:hypothetical protein
MKLFKVGAAILAAAALSGCISTNATMLGGTMVGAGTVATDPESIAVYRTADQVPSSYKELALLNSTGGSLITNERQMFNSMKKEAAKAGANGIILDAITEPSPAVQVAAAIFGVGANRKGKALAILIEGRPVVPAPVKGKRTATK